MASDSKWLFTKEQIANSPSRKYNIDAEKEMKYRQQYSSFIQELGQSLKLSQLSINTAIVYTHRFFMFHSLAKFDKYKIGIAALFLAAKVEDTPTKMEYIIHHAYKFLYKTEGPLITTSQKYLMLVQELMANENALLMTFGFEVTVLHPHPYIVYCCDLIKANKDLKQTSYFMASNSLHLTTMCLQYRPTVVACFCIHMASKWTSCDIPLSKDEKPWFWYIDKDVTFELLDKLTEEFFHVFDKCPAKLKLISQLNPVNQLKKICDVEMTKNFPLPNHQFIHHHHKPEMSITQRLVQLKNMIPTPPVKQISIFSPENTSMGDSQKSREWITSQQQSDIHKVLSFNSPKNVQLPIAGLSDVRQNSLKQRATNQDDFFQKHQCSFNDVEKSAKIRDEISAILRITDSSELLKPVLDISRVNSSITDRSLLESEESFKPEPTMTHHISLNPTINILEKRLRKEILPVVQKFPRIKEETWNTQDSSKNGLEINNRISESPINTIPGNYSMIDKRFSKVVKSAPTSSLSSSVSFLDRIERQDFPVAQEFLKDKETWKAQDILNTCRVELSSTTDFPKNIVEFSQILPSYVEESTDKGCEENKDIHHKSWKSKKEKKERKTDKDRKTQKRKREVEGQEQYCDMEKNKVKENAFLMPIKISIPKKKLIFSSNLVLTSESGQKTSEESILKFKILKKLSHDTESISSPVESFQPLNLKIPNDKETNKITWLTQSLQSVSHGY